MVKMGKDGLARRKILVDPDGLLTSRPEPRPSLIVAVPYTSVLLVG